MYNSKLRPLHGAFLPNIKYFRSKLEIQFSCKTKQFPQQSGIMINVNVSAKIQKNIMHVKNIIFGILLHVVVKMLNIQQVLLTIQ